MVESGSRSSDHGSGRGEATPKRARPVRWRKMLAFSVALSTLVGCAASEDVVFSPTSVTSLFKLTPVSGWAPPGWNNDLGIGLLSGNANDGIGDGAGEGTDESFTEESFADGSFGDGASIGLTAGRIRNDTIGFAARYVQVPMRHRFNDQMDELLWQTIANAERASGGTFTPETFPESANLNDRGCVSGSLSWPAERVLSDPETGTATATGTAVTCEILEAAGNMFGVGMRVVIGDAGRDAGRGLAEAKIEADQVSNLFFDVSSGVIHEEVTRWNAEAPAELWRGAAELLRRGAGGLSTSEFAPPTEDQIAIAQAALDTARKTSSGALLLTLGSGLTSPELQALGEAPTTAALDMRVESEVAVEWVSGELAAIHPHTTDPFAGLPDWNAGLPVNCMLLACIAVTYDDGPSTDTPRLLDTLWKLRAPATFYVVGREVKDLPDIVARAAREGHEVGSHTMTHPELTKLPEDEARDEVLDAAELIESVTGDPVTSFRPPYGDINDDIIKDVELPAILWSVDPEDWKLPGHDALLERSVGEARIGDIILFHDVHAETVDAAQAIFDGLRDRGFTPVTVTELFDGSLPEEKAGRK